MRIALLSDIHANLPALEAVLVAVAAEPNVAATYHLGWDPLESTCRHASLSIL